MVTRGTISLDWDAQPHAVTVMFGDPQFYYLRRIIRLGLSCKRFQALKTAGERSE